VVYKVIEIFNCYFLDEFWVSDDESRLFEIVESDEPLTKTEIEALKCLSLTNNTHFDFLNLS
jgi:hypothetical protein